MGMASNRGANSTQGDDPVWQSWGGWSSGAHRVLAGWVRDPATATVVASDPDGRSVEGTVRDDIAVLFLTPGFTEVAEVRASPPTAACSLRSLTARRSRPTPRPTLRPTA
ncbi:MAG: hypothetical protein V9G19_00545 [Tetrasphaera sp.]